VLRSCAETIKSKNTVIIFDRIFGFDGFSTAAEHAADLLLKVIMPE